MGWNLAASLAALAGFLGGLFLLRSGLAGLASTRLPIVLHQFVKTPTRGIVTGTICSALMQSSAAVTAITVGMVAGGTMAFHDAVGVILGANVGSTVTPQLLTLDLWRLAVPCLVAGVAGYLLGPRRWRDPCTAITGFAVMFISLEVLTTALAPLAHTAWFVRWLQAAGQQPVLAALTGCLASAAIQSSTATTVITMALAEQGAIPLTGGIAIVLGANVGSCLTSVLAAIGQSRAAQRVALAHVLLNLLGAAAVLPFIDPFAAWMRALASSPDQQLADAHTIFNIFCTLLVWPVTYAYAAFIERLLPDRPELTG